VPTVTHLFNGMPRCITGPRDRCPRAAKAGKAVVELIADNTHLDPHIVSAVFDLVDADNIALVTDSMAAAGLADGTYTLGPSEVQVRNGVARLTTTGSIAGGTATMLDVVRRTVRARVLSLTRSVRHRRPGTRSRPFNAGRRSSSRPAGRPGYGQRRSRAGLGNVFRQLAVITPLPSGRRNVKPMEERRSRKKENIV